MWLCRCDCGEVRKVVGHTLRSGASQSCGCKPCLHPAGNRTHGGRNDRLYQVWRGIKDRCQNHNSKYYSRYGAKGIDICAEWENDYASFKQWSYNNGYTDNTPKYTCTIDRIDNTKGYSPDNCRWANMIEQSNNRSNNHLLTFGGKTHTISEWSRLKGIRKDTLRRRIEIYHWPVERALTEQTHTHTKHSA